MTDYDESDNPSNGWQAPDVTGRTPRVGEWTAAARAQAVGMRGQLPPAAVAAYLLAGHAVITVVSGRTGVRFTYKVVKADPSDRYPGDAWFVNVLRGADNTADFTYIGIIRDGRFQRTTRTKVTAGALSFVAFAFLWEHRAALPSGLTVFHEGCCMTGLTRAQLLAFCAALIAHAASHALPQRRDAGLDLSVCVEGRIVAPAPGKPPYPLVWACPRDGATHIALEAHCLTLKVVHHVAPAVLQQFLHEHAERLLELQAASMARHLRVPQAQNAAAAALGFRWVLSAWSLPEEAALASLARLTECAPAVAAALRQSADLGGC